MSDKYYFHYKKNNKPQKIIIGLCCAIAAALILFGAVGIIAGSNSEDRQTVSDAIEENINLKRKLSDMQTELNDLKQKTEELEEELKARPTFTPSPSSNKLYISPSPSPTEQAVPRERVRD